MLNSLKYKIELLGTEHAGLHRQEWKLALREGLEQSKLEEEGKLLKLRHRRVHKSLRSLLALAGLTSSGRLRNKQLWKVNRIVDLPYNTFGELYSALLRQFGNLKPDTERENLCYELFDTLESGLEWKWLGGAYCHLYAIYVRYPHMNLLDFYKPVLPTIFDGLPSKNKRMRDADIRQGVFEVEAKLSQRVLQSIEAERKRAEAPTRTFASCISELKPPLTWGEVLFREISLQPGTARQELDELFATRRYCIECDRVFPEAKNNPGYFRCKQCSQRLRQSRHRQRARSSETC